MNKENYITKLKKYPDFFNSINNGYSKIHSNALFSPKFLSFLSKPNETEWKTDKEKRGSCSEMVGQCKSRFLS